MAGANDTVRPLPGVSFPQMVEAWARKEPDALAVEAQPSRAGMSYAELDARANRFARVLAGAGVGPGTLVGLCADRSPDMVAALVGIWKAGGAFVPLDAAHPAGRLELVIRDARLALVPRETSP